MWKYLFAITVSAVVITSSVYLFRHRDEWFRPDVQKVGGTLIAFAIEDGQPDEAYFTKMRARFDPRGRIGVVARSGEGNEVEILVPQGPAHDDTVDRITRLAARPGTFSFVPIANRSVDEGVAKYAQETYAPGKAKARTTPPPLPVNALGRREFTLSIAGSAPCRYRWVRLGDAVLDSFLLDPTSLAGANLAEKPTVERALRTGTVLLPATNPECMILAARSTEAPAPAFYLLVGDESEVRSLTPRQIRTAELSKEIRGINAISLRLEPEGAARLSAMHQQFYSTPSAFPRPKMTAGHAFFALVIDDRIVSLPALDRNRQLEATMAVGSSGEDVEDLVCLLRGPISGVRLKAKPTRVEALEPRK